MDNYIVLKEIGHGAYGKALKAVSRENHDVIVIKQIELRLLSTKQRSDALNEVNVLRQLRHPYIVRHLANFVDSGKLCILMEFAAGGDLGTRIKAMKLAGTMFPESQISRWFAQILLGLSFMHSKNVMHRDLKPHNIFLSSEGDKALIGDFGVCRVMESRHQLAQTITGTPYYLSPEVFQRKPYSFKSDLWALGCILYELASLSVPFDAIDVVGLSAKVCRGSNPSFPARYSPGLKEIFQALMQRDHRSRPSADELLSRPYISSVVNAIINESPNLKPDCFITAASIARSPSATPRRRMSDTPIGLPPTYKSSPKQQSRSNSPAPRRINSPAPRSLSPRTVLTSGRPTSSDPRPISTRPPGTTRNTSPLIRQGNKELHLNSSPRERYCTPSRVLSSGTQRSASPQRLVWRSSPPRISLQRSPSPHRAPSPGSVSSRPLKSRSPSARKPAQPPLKELNSINAVHERPQIRKNSSPSRIYPPSPLRQRVPLS